MNAAKRYRAAWFIYLNRTCFNGLYRENSKGEFNVPIGRYTSPVFCDEETIRAWSKALAQASLLTCSWEHSMSNAERDEFVFIDPPYVPATKTANFTGYQAGGFGPEAQARLAESLGHLDGRGVKWMLTNSAEARYLYDRWNTLSVPVRRAINSNGEKRQAVGEIIVTNYDIGSREAVAGISADDGEFIAAAREDVPALVAQCRADAKTIERLTRERDEAVAAEREVPRDEDRVCPTCHRVVDVIEDHHGWCVEALREVAEDGRCSCVAGADAQQCGDIHTDPCVCACHLSPVPTLAGVLR